MGSFNIDDVTKFVPERDSSYRRRIRKSDRSSKNFDQVYRRESREDQQKEKEYEDISKDKNKTVEVRKDLTTKETGKKKKTPDMVFDLHRSQKGKKNKETMASLKQHASSLRDESLSALNKYVNSKENLESLLDKSGLKKSSDTALAGAAETMQYATEQPDIAYVNPLSQADNSAVSLKVDPQTMKVNIQELVNQIVTIKQKGEMDTTMTLKHPPLFEGVKVTISEFQTAKGEINIKFENLTQAAKNLIDMQSNQDALRLGLEQKGIIVHIMTATTYNEVRPMETQNASSGEHGNKEEQPDKQDEQEHQKER